MWFSMYAGTHNKNGRIEWPDGGCYLEQTAMLLEVWAIIGSELALYAKEQSK